MGNIIPPLPTMPPDVGSDRRLREALEKIKGGFINSGCLMSSPPDWHSAFNQLQAIAKDALDDRIHGGAGCG